jgi:hypothetical protein
MSYPSDPASGYRPGSGAGYGGEPAQYPPPNPDTQVLPPGPYIAAENPTRVQPGYGPPGYDRGLPGYDPGYAPGPPGYGPPGYGPPGYVPGPPPDKSRKWAYIFGGILVLVICAGGGFYGAYALTQSTAKVPSAAPSPPPVLASDSPAPVPSAPPSPSEVPSADPSAGVPGQVFADPELRDFAGNAAQNAQCQEQPPGDFAGVTEVVNCQFSNFTVRYLKFDSGAGRDQYAQRVRDGLDGQLDVQRNSVWTNRRGERQGRFIAGSQENDTRQYVYWNSDNAAVSGELVIGGSRRSDAEQAWRSL